MTGLARASAFSLLALVVRVHAADAQDLDRTTLQDLLNVKITTATRMAESVGDAPARVQVVTASQIQRRGYRSLADLLEDLPDFKVDIGGDQDYPTELVVQGMRGTSRVILLLDGIRVSSPTNEPLPILANYPVHHARQIEIVYGPGSAVYGADAFSAVINVISRDATEANGLTMSSSMSQYGLYNHTASYGARFRDKVSVMLSGQFYYDGQPNLSKYYPADFGRLESHRTGIFNTIFGPMTPTGSVSPDYRIPISAHSMQATIGLERLRLTLFKNSSRAPTTPAYTPDNGVYNADAFNKNDLIVGALTYTQPVGRATSTSTLTLSHHELDPESGYWNVYSNLTKSYKYAFGSMAKLEQQLTWKPAPSVAAALGASVERYHAIPQGADLNAPVRSHDAPGTILGTTLVDQFNEVRYSNTGVYAQLQYAVSADAALTFGGRADYNTRYGATFNPRLGALVRPTDATTVKLMYGSAFLAPSPYQAYAHYGSFYSVDGGATYASSFWHVGNPNLKPQQKDTVEVNILHGLTRHVHLSGSAFYSRFTSMVNEVDPELAGPGTLLGWPVDYIDFPVNQGRAYIYGGTIGVDFLQVFDSERSVEARAAVAVADGQVWDENEGGVGLPIESMVPVQFRLSTDVDWRQWTVAPRLAIFGSQRLRATIEEDGLTRRRTLDGYATVDLSLRRRNVINHVDAFVLVENALDRRYRAINARAYTNPEEFIGAPQNPRRITAGFALRLK